MPKALARWIDPAVAVLLGATYFLLLLATTRELGYARDEGFYFVAASSYERWFELLFTDPARALERGVVERYWAANHEHPALMKSLFALGHHFLHREWGWVELPGTAYRIPGMAMSALCVAVTYAWGSRAVSRSAGLVAAVLLGMMPRVFYHAHLACFDMPVAAMWLVTTYAYARAIEQRGWRWPLLTWLLYGLLLNTKHNSWLLPPALLAHYFLTTGARVRELRALRAAYASGALQAPLTLLGMGLLSPLLFYATWPWIWHDTIPRLQEYVAFHTGHDYYNMEFLGRTYWKPPMPLGYAWVMTLATVPTTTLALSVVGGGLATRELLRRYVPQRWRERWRWLDNPELAAAPTSTALLWLLCILTSYAPWLRSDTPIFGGTKHWITAYPFLCLFAARGFEACRARFADWACSRGRAVSTAGALALGATAVAAPVVITLGSHPWGLSSYVPLVGGAPGAASLGLNRTFWGYTTGALEDYLNRVAPPNAVVFVHDTALQSWEMFKADGRLRSDLRGSLHVAGSKLALYHHEPHMQKVEYQIWVDYGTTAPAEIGTHDGVPVVWVYRRPQR